MFPAAETFTLIDAEVRCGIIVGNALIKGYNERTVYWALKYVDTAALYLHVLQGYTPKFKPGHASVATQFCLQFTHTTLLPLQGNTRHWRCSQLMSKVPLFCMLETICLIAVASLHSAVTFLCTLATKSKMTTSSVNLENATLSKGSCSVLVV